MVSSMNRKAKTIVVLLVGWGFMLLGVAGLILPIMPGWIFIFVGLIILSTEYVWAHHLLTRIREKFPRFGGVLEQANQKARAWMERLSGQREAD